MMIRENWADLLLPGLREIYDKQLKKTRDYVAALYNEDKSDKAQEITLGAGSLGIMKEWSESGNQVAYEDINKGFKQTYTHKKFSKGLLIERELVEDDLYGEIKKRVKTLVNSVWYTRQYYGASVFNNAFNANFKGPDGVPLCSNSHPVAPGSTEVWSNAGNLPLTADNVEATRTEMMEWKDDKGNILAVNPDTLIVPPALRKAALVIADTDKEPDTAENNINIWRGSLNVIEFPFITSRNVWFLVSMERMKTFLRWFNRRKAVLQKDKENFDTEVAKFKVVARFSFGWDDPSFIYGHQFS